MEDTRPILLVTTVDIGDGQSGKIELREGDDPVEAAREFCRQYGLPDAIVGPLSLHICENIERSAEEAAAQGMEGAEPPAAGAPPSPPEPDSPSLDDDFLPDDSPSAAGPPPHAAPAQPAYAQRLDGPAGPPPPAHAGYGQPPHLQVYGQRPAPYEPAEPSAPPAAEPLGYTAAGPSRGCSGEEALQMQLRLQRPSSAPHPQEAALPGAGAGALEPRRPASVNSAYGRRGAPPAAPASSSGSGGSSYGSGGRHNPAAHNRLYADYFNKQTRLDEERRLRDLEVQLKMQQVHVTPVSQALASHRSAAGYKNYGERLYVEGRLDAMRKEKEAERAKQQEEEEALTECVFRPEISSMARALKAVEGEVGGGAAWQRLYQRRQMAAKHKERMETIKREQEEEAVRECTFRPHINARSQRMVQDRQAILKESGIPGYEQLFNESIRRRLKQEHLARLAPEEATFRPRINTSSVVLRKLMEGRPEGSGGGGGEEGGAAGDVAARLLERGRRYHEKLERAREVLHGRVDPSTGKPLFRPQTCRAPKFERNPAGAPIGEYLYSIQREREEKMSAALSTSQQRAAASASSTYVNKRSEKLVEKLKRDRFRAIFDYLRRDEQGTTLNLVATVQDETFMDTIDPEVRADIEYAAKQLAKHIARRSATELQDSADSASHSEAVPPPYANSTHGEVDAAGFHALMEDVLQRTSGISRQYLLPMPSGRKKFEEPTFQPAINPHSKLIAARRRPEHVPTYEVLYKTAEEVEHKREERKKLLEAAALEECVFNPKLQAKQLVKEGKALKLAATLSTSHRGQADEHGSVVDQVEGAVAQQAQQEGAGEPFDHIERQIQDALVRLSLSGEAIAAANAAGAAQAGGAAGILKSNRNSIDYRALFDSPSPGPEGAPATAAASSMAAFNPLDGGDSPTTCPAAPGLRQSTLEWCESEDHLVANFEGLDLHAIASASMEMPPAGGAFSPAGKAGALGALPAVPASPAESSV